ncbi:hypothetical protein QA596_10895 [Balneolales bacterium ANBcel1]|nr:hypothetical protein [Balneolales bacterium ANBcel1]
METDLQLWINRQYLATNVPIDPANLKDKNHRLLYMRMFAYGDSEQSDTIHNAAKARMRGTTGLPPPPFFFMAIAQRDAVAS